MTLTVFDVLDAVLLAAAIAAVIASGRPRVLVWPVAALAAYHILGRQVLTWPDNALSLAALQTMAATGYLFSPILSNYGRMIASLFLAMSLAGVAATLTATVPPLGQGLGFNLWNFQSACLHMASLLTIAGVLRHGHLYGGNAARRG